MHNRKHQKRAVRRERAKGERKNEQELIQQIEEKLANEAPPKGTNPLVEDLKQTDVSAYFPAAKRFEELPLSPQTMKGLKTAGYVKMTAIQRATLPHALCGRDILAAAKTGSGKTLAFLIPVLELLWRSSWNQLDGLGALILSPTRELALQTFEVLRKIGKYHANVSAGLVIGGSKNVKREADSIGKMMILVSTPGRLLQHMDENPSFSCDYLKLLILDEADRILDMGFEKALTQILDNLPEERQTLLFSATQTTSVSQLARLSLNEPEYISVHANSTFSTPSKLSQYYMICPLETKINLLWSFLRTHLTSKMMVFFSSQKQALKQLRPGISLLQLHGNMSQQKRMDVYWKFHDQERKINMPGACLLCTDIAARGLDFKGVDWVIQLDCPEDSDTYIHRAGRTARMNKDGKALLILLPSEEKFAEQLKNRKIPLEQLECNPDKQQNIQKQLQELCLTQAEIKLLAQKSLKSYVRSMKLMSNKEVFKPEELDLEAYAHSLGLVTAPKLSETVVKVDKNKLITQHRLDLLAKQAEDAEKAGLSVIPIKLKKKEKTHVERLLKRKNTTVLSPSALDMVNSSGSDSDGEDVLRKKTGKQAHMSEELDKQPTSKKKRDFVSIDDVDMPLDNKGDYLSKALQELRGMDASDRKRHQDKLRAERRKKKQAEKEAIERPMPSVVLGNPDEDIEDGEGESSEENKETRGKNRHGGKKFEDNRGQKRKHRDVYSEGSKSREYGDEKEKGKFDRAKGQGNKKRRLNK